jgi:preprotein translocase subunit SecA
VGSGFGVRTDPFNGRPALHAGLDFPAEPGTPIYAAAGGMVSANEWHAAYGNLLEIDHGNGLKTRYAHNSSVDVALGTLVRRGQQVAKVGNTGRSTGPHLHFEVLVDGAPQDPARFLAGNPSALEGVCRTSRPTLRSRQALWPQGRVLNSNAFVRCRFKPRPGSPSRPQPLARAARAPLQTGEPPPIAAVWRARCAPRRHPHPTSTRRRMFPKILTQIFGSRNDRLLKSYRREVEQINALEPQFQKLDDAALRAKTDELRQRLAQGATLDQLLPEAFAVAREASKRTLKMRHFDVQLVGGIALHQGKIAEMRTGEGKTLMATLPVYLNALAGKGVHLVTVNDYLARRDAEWMGRLYGFLGLTVGVNVPGMNREEKQAAFAADVTYGTNNEFGFDYLRDNMVQDVADRVARGLNYAIVDEVDSILIDEARTPLIISGQAEDHTEMYGRINAIVPGLKKQIGEEDIRTGEGVIDAGDFTVDEKAHQIFLTEAGHENAERLLTEAGLLAEGASLYDPANIALMHHVYAALRANHLYNRDQHYVVQNGEVIIVDEFTGRLMTGRRWSDGLHQAVEAKEGVHIQSENQTLASVTFQNYFRMYSKLGGMTGTADTEAYEFQEIYGLETVVIPPNKPTIRKDDNDLIYKTAKEKYDAVTKDIQDCYERGQPVLVGTTSIENSELISELLTKAKLPHQVLNAKQHAKEAEIVAQAGRPKMVTIATNMAGRGTDIVLGGNVEKQIQFLEADESLSEEEKQTRAQKLKDEWQSLHEQVKAQGGLRIVATERHESRRIDNQLRGRSGRQGDPGASRFYLSLDDPLMRIFAGDRVRAIMDRLKMPEGEAIEAGIVNRSIESAQRKVEARNFDIRKQLLEYDDVANDQRKVIYQQRNEILEAQTLDEQISNLRKSTMNEVVRTYVPAGTLEEQWDLDALERVLREEWQFDVALKAMVEKSDSITDEDIVDAVVQAADTHFKAKVELVGSRAVHALHAHGAAAEHRQPLARAPGRAGLPAPGHPPARLRAEEPQAGIQARSLRAVLAIAGRGQDGSHAHPDDGAHPEPGPGCRSRAGAGRASRPALQRDLQQPQRRRQRLATGRHGLAE